MLKTRAMALPKFPMWGHQGSFQWLLQDAAERLFATLGPGLEPGVFVIGLKLGNNPYQAPIGLVPEQTVCKPADFSSLTDQIAALRNLAFAEKGQPMVLVEDVRRAFDNAIVGLQESLEKTLNALPLARDRIFFCSALCLVKGYLAAVVLFLDRRAYDAFPRLPRDLDDNLPGSFPSLLDATAAELLEVGGD